MSNYNEIEVVVDDKYSKTKLVGRKLDFLFYFCSALCFGTAFIHFIMSV